MVSALVAYSLVLRIRSILAVEGCPADGVAEFPLIGEPGVKVAGGPSGKVQEELGEVELGIDLVPAAGRGQAGENSGGAAAARFANEQGVFAVTEIFP